MSKDYNDGLDTAASIVEEMLRGTSEGETILCGIESSKKQIDDESPYCGKCDSCGETGCCPPIKCEAVKCKYGEINLKDYNCFQDQWEVMFNALKNIVSNPDQKSPDSDFYFSDKEYAQNALNEVDKLWDKLYSKAQTTDHEPSVAVHDVFSTAIPNAFGVDFLRCLISKPDNKEQA